MVINENEKTIYQFQLGYMLNPELNINRAFKKQVGINLEKSFSGATMMPISGVLKNVTLVCFHL